MSSGGRGSSSRNKSRPGLDTLSREGDVPTKEAFTLSASIHKSSQIQGRCTKEGRKRPLDAKEGATRPRMRMLESNESGLKRALNGDCNFHSGRVQRQLLTAQNARDRLRGAERTRFHEKCCIWNEFSEKFRTVSFRVQNSHTLSNNQPRSIDKLPLIPHELSQSSQKRPLATRHTPPGGVFHPSNLPRCSDRASRTFRLVGTPLFSKIGVIKHCLSQLIAH